MNWRKLDELWRNYADSNKLKIEVNDRQLFGGVTTTYLITSSEFKLKGILQRNVSPLTNSKNFTQLIIESEKWKNDLDLIDKRILGISINSKNDSELIQLIKSFNAKRLKIRGKELILEFNYIFSDSKQFELIDQMKIKLMAAASC
jgi:hypothetical protein